MPKLVIIIYKKIETNFSATLRAQIIKCESKRNNCVILCFIFYHYARKNFNRSQEKL